MTTRVFQNLVWKFYDAHGRHELPWRLNLDPYAILVSEVMLQQTQVDRVIPKYEAWLAALPTFESVAQAPLPIVLKLWQGLGYNRRALNLQRAAQTLVELYGGRLPRPRAALLALPGIGPYTAAAIQAFAFNEPVAMIETNIRTVFLHHYFTQQKKVADDTLIPLIKNTIDTDRPREWYWALMDYGAQLKKTHKNPARHSAHHVRQPAFVGSHRQVRGAIIRALTKAPALSEQALSKQLQREGIAAARIAPALQQLIHESFIMHDRQQKKFFFNLQLLPER